MESSATPSEGMNRALTPLQNQLNELLDGNPDIARMFRKVAPLIMMEAHQCPALRAHPQCLMGIQERTKTLLLLGIFYPEALDTIFAGFKPNMEAMSGGTLDWNYFENGGA